VVGGDPRGRHYAGVRWAKERRLVERENDVDGAGDADAQCGVELRHTAGAKTDSAARPVGNRARDRIEWFSRCQWEWAISRSSLSPLEIDGDSTCDKSS
jgi:hypothetical protein